MANFKVKSLYFTNGNKTHKCGEIIKGEHLKENPEKLIKLGWIEETNEKVGDSEPKEEKPKKEETVSEKVEETNETEEAEDVEETEDEVLKTTFISMEDDPKLSCEEVKKAEIMKELEVREIEYDSSDKKATLFNKLL